MKLHCNVEVNNRMHNISSVPKRRSQRACLVLGRECLKNKEIYILLQTMQNKCGSKYRIDDNIEKIFEKFIEKGKASIRIKEPPHDLIIQCNAIPLKSFIRTLKLVISKKVDPSVLAVSNLDPKKIYNPLKVKMLIKSNSEYPTLKGFPKYTEELYLTKLERKSFDLQILKLPNLKVLDLSNNQIKYLPKELGCMPNLCELNLAQNNLSKATDSKWAWLEQTNIRNNLRMLDISSNSLSVLPQQIGKFRALVNLKVSQNLLTGLPQSLGTLCCLKYLDLSQNNLYCLPGSMKKLRLISIDISNNPFPSRDAFVHKLRILSLVELCGRVICQTKQIYNSSIIPRTLVKYLDNANYCTMCGIICLESYLRQQLHYNLSLTACNIKSSNGGVVPFDCFFCSWKCYNAYTRLKGEIYF